MSVQLSFSITPEMVSITDFSFKQLSEDENIENIFNNLECNQHNVLIRLFLWIKRFFGFNAELRLEESSNISHQPGI